MRADHLKRPAGNAALKPDSKIVFVLLKEAVIAPHSTIRLNLSHLVSQWHLHLIQLILHRVVFGAF